MDLGVKTAYFSSVQKVLETTLQKMQKWSWETSGLWQNLDFIIIHHVSKTLGALSKGFLRPFSCTAYVLPNNNYNFPTISRCNLWHVHNQLKKIKPDRLGRIVHILQ